MNEIEETPSREWTCPVCGRKMGLFAVNCVECGERLTDEEAERQGITGRNSGLPESVRREFEEARRSQSERRRLHEEHLKKRFLRDLALGGGIGFLSQILLACLAGSAFYPLVSVLLGMAAGGVLNRRGGGRFTGTALFGSAFVMAWFVSVAFTGTDPLANQLFAVAFFVMGFSGLAISLGAGYLFGMTLTFERFDEGF